MAQLPEPNQMGVGMGHLHLKSGDVPANKKFWINTLGGTVGKFGQMEVFNFPGVIVMVQTGAAKGGTEGSAINHLGFVVKNLDPYVEKLKAEGHRDLRVEGLTQSDWVLVDAGDVIVHIFRPEVRTFYNLEKLWSEHAPDERIAS